MSQAACQAACQLLLGACCGTVDETGSDKVFCARCGSAVSASDERCPRCGALAAAPSAAPPLLPDTQGIPVLHFSPTAFGPPVAPEPYLGLDRPGERLDVRHAPYPRTQLRVVLPQPVYRRSESYPRLVLILTALAVTCLAALVLAGLLVGLLVGMGALTVPPGFAPGGVPPVAAPTATATPSCATASADPAAAQALSHAQLTTGLRDEPGQDFRPVDDVNTFHIGTRAYITFQIATAQAGTIDVTFCTPAGRIPGSLDVPAGSTGRYAQFSILLQPSQIGAGVATLTWDGVVAASLPFTVAT